MGGSLGFELPRLLSGWLLRANFSAIQSLAYRTVLPWEEYSVERIGIGWDKVDLYLVTLEADGYPSAGLWIGPRIDIQILGEGDFRELRPDPIPPDFPRILVGQAETRRAQCDQQERNRKRDDHDADSGGESQIPKVQIAEQGAQRDQACDDIEQFHDVTPAPFLAAACTIHQSREEICGLGRLLPRHTL